MNARVVVSSSEVALREILEGQPPELVEELANDLRIRLAFGWTGPEASRAPLVVHRKEPDGSISVDVTQDLIEAGAIRWDGDRLAFVTQPGDPAEYTIPGGDDELSEVMDHPSVPEAARERLRVYQARMDPTPATRSRIMAAIRAQLGIRGTQPTQTKASYKLVAFVAPPTMDLPTDDGKKIRVDHASGQDQCVIELVPPLPEEVDRSEFVLRLGGRIIRPIDPIDEHGYFTVRFSDIRDILFRNRE